MIKKLHNKKIQKKIFIIIAVLILPAFLFWGYGSVVRGKKESGYVGKIFGKKISLLNFQESLNATKNMAIIQYGEVFGDIQDSLGLEQQAWERLVLLSEAKRRSLKASDKEVVETIENYPFLQKNGKFDNIIYNQMLQYVFRTQPRTFEEQTRENIILSKLYKEVTKGVNITDEEVLGEYKKLNQTVSVYYIAANKADFEKNISFEEKDLRDYFVKNKIAFKKPLSFNIEYVKVNSEEDQESAAKTIKDLYKKLSADKVDFAKIAKDSGIEVKETGIFSENDAIPGIGWSPQIIKIITKAKINDYLGPMQFDKYFYILKVKEKKDPYIPGFEEIKDKVGEKYIKELALKKAKGQIEACLEQLKKLSSEKKPVNFEKIAKEFDLKYGASESFKFGSYIEGIGSSDSFWKEAQELKENEFSPILETPSGFYIIKVKSIPPINNEEFESKRKEYQQLFLQQKKVKVFSESLEELKSKSQRF